MWRHNISDIAIRGGRHCLACRVCLPENKLKRVKISLKALLPVVLLLVRERSVSMHLYSTVQILAAWEPSPTVQNSVYKDSMQAMRPDYS